MQYDRRQALKGLATVATSAAGLPLLGCGSADEFDGEGDIGQAGQAFTAVQWRTLEYKVSAPGSITSEPALFSNTPGWTTAVRSSDKTFYVRRAGMTLESGWIQFGTRQFESPPAATMQNPYPGTGELFVLAGRTSDNRLYTLEGRLPTGPNDQPPPDPAWTEVWRRMKDVDNGSAANPALAAGPGRIVLTFLKSNLIYAHVRLLPYLTNSWSADAAPSPSFPAGVTPKGVPAITYLGGNFNKYVVMVRCTTANGNKLYWIYFNGTSFQGNWVQAFTEGVTIDSDPSIEWDFGYNALTIYVRSGNSIIHTSVTGPGGVGIYSWNAIPQAPNSTLSGAPRAAYGAGIEGVRAVIIRGYGPATPAGQNGRGVAYAETPGFPNPFPV
jgi:hypothetical protein